MYWYPCIERYLGASYDILSLVDKLLHQLASKQTIVVNVYDMTNASAPITMYGTDVVDTGLLHISSIDFGDLLRKHEMHCRYVFCCKVLTLCPKNGNLMSGHFQISYIFQVQA